MVKQCTFLDLMEEPGSLMGGIMLDNGDVICGCCGGIFEKADEGTTWKLVKVMDDWIDLDYVIRERLEGENNDRAMEDENANLPVYNEEWTTYAEEKLGNMMLE